MNDPQANAQLELACRGGAADDLLEALEEGADINCSGSSPLFIAIMASDRDIVSVLVEKGADVSLFEITATGHDEIVDGLMKLAPATGEDPGESAVDAKQLRAFDRMIRNKGLAEPIRKGRGEEYAGFLEGLKWIAAEQCHAIVKDFLDLLGDLPAETDPAVGIPRLLEDHAERVAELGNRYAGAEEIPRELLKDYLKEQKRLAGSNSTDGK